MFEFGKGKRPAEEQHMQSRDSTAIRQDNQTPATGAPARAVTSGQPAVIGPSIRIDGDLQGEEDLIIEGEVHGTVNLRGNALTIGSKGQVKADVYAHSIRVEGHMEGDLFAAERAVITKTANVRGNITAPRVNLEDGARFRGAIEMDPESLQPVFGAGKSSGVTSAGAGNSSTASSPGTAAGASRGAGAARAAGAESAGSKDQKAAS